MSKFNVGDTVYLLEGAHGGYGTLGYTPEKFIGRLDDYGLTFDAPWLVVREVDVDGDVRIARGGIAVYVLEKFLTKEKPAPEVHSPEQCAPVTLEAIKRIGEAVTPVINVSAAVDPNKPKPETVEVEKLLEAQELLDSYADSEELQKLIKIAQRLK